MKEYLYLWLLRYFALNSEQFSLQEIVDQLGIGYEQLDRLLSKLLEDGMLEQRNGTLYITFQGRIELQRLKMDEIYKLEDQGDNMFLEGLSLETPFVVKNFSEKKWFGKE